MYSSHATSAIHRLDSLRHKRHIGRTTATIAVDLRVLARLMESLIASLVATHLAVLGLIDEMLAVKPSLLAHIPQKLDTAVLADQPLV